MHKKVVIIGSGPAAWTAALYAARAELVPLVFAGFQMGGRRGGQLMLTTEVENFPGFPKGITGPELVELMEEQAKRFNVEVLEEDVLEIEANSDIIKVFGSKTSVQTNALIVATGAYAKRLDVKGDQEFWGRGITACATCDGPMPVFRNQDLAVVGGGDSACEEALFLTKYGKKVYMVLRRDQFRASKIMEERVKEASKIEILYNYDVEEIYGDRVVSGIRLKHVKSQEIREVPVKGVFYGIGHTPNTAFLKGLVELDETGYMIVKGDTTITSKPGIFAAGDVSDKRYRQAITAAGMGCKAALDVEKYLSEKGIH